MNSEIRSYILKNFSEWNIDTIKPEHREIMKNKDFFKYGCVFCDTIDCCDDCLLLFREYEMAFVCRECALEMYDGAKLYYQMMDAEKVKKGKK